MIIIHVVYKHGSYVSYHGRNEGLIERLYKNPLVKHVWVYDYNKGTKITEWSRV